MARQYFQQRLFGVHLRQFRDKHKLTQNDVAGMIRVSSAHISALEKGELKNHEIFPILDLCDLMNVDVRDYFSKFEEKF